MQSHGIVGSAGVAPTASKERQARGMTALKMLREEISSLAAGGDGLKESTKLITKKRGLKDMMTQLNYLSADENDANDPATVATLSAAQQCIEVVFEARGLRVSQINADLPPAQFLTLNVVGFLVLGSFLLLELKNDNLEAGLFGAVTGAVAIFHRVLRDLACPFNGQWSVAAAQSSGDDLLALIDEEIAEVKKAGEATGQRRAASPPRARATAK